VVLGGYGRPGAFAVFVQELQCTLTPPPDLLSRARFQLPLSAVSMAVSPDVPVCVRLRAPDSARPLALVIDENCLDKVLKSHAEADFVAVAQGAKAVVRSPLPRPFLLLPHHRLLHFTSPVVRCHSISRYTSALFLVCLFGILGFVLVFAVSDLLPVPPRPEGCCCEAHPGQCSERAHACYW
jgi:hypothetical protein